MTDEHSNKGFEDVLDAVADGEGYYLECENGHGHLPPRRICPDCGSRAFTERPVPAAGEVETYTITRVATPEFEADTPYVVAVADFGPVRLTGQVRDVDAEDVEVGMVVAVDVDKRATTDDDLLVFRPR
jgi:uncharacterized OB-fold protein